MSEGLVLNGRFRLIEQIDSGGMGAVWRAEDLELEAQAAVKLIDPELLTTPEALARFQREAKAAAAIRSTHVVQILGYGVQPVPVGEPQPYIAMELLKGETLAARLDRVWRLSVDEAIPILTHIARALSVAHAAGIVHRDLKPENVFLVNEMGEDVGKILDFGIARQKNAFSKSNGVETQSGAVLGTPYYMSPEQTAGGDVDHRSDLWAFGVIAYECLLGVRPFDRDTLGGLFNAICIAERPVPSKEGPVPDGFDAWFARATARVVRDRYQTIEEAITALRVICGQSPGRALTPPTFLLTESSAPAHSSGSSYTPPPSAKTILGARKYRSRRLAFTLSAIAVLFATGLTTWHWMARASLPSSVSAAGPALRGLRSDADLQQSGALVGDNAMKAPVPGAQPSPAAEPSVGVSELPLVTDGPAAHPAKARTLSKVAQGAKTKRAPGTSSRPKENVAGF